MEQKRILQVTSVLNRGGIETLLVNVLKNIDREKIVFDFLVIREDCGVFEEEIKNLGGRIFKIPSLKKTGVFKLQKNLNSFFQNHSEYTIVHSHVNAWSYYILKSAKKFGIPTRIAHSHTSASRRGTVSDLFVSYCKRRIVENSTDLFACSKAAAEYLFDSCSENTVIVKNGIDCKRFEYSNDSKIRIRRQFGIEDKFVIITVGRISKEKNHTFFLNILSEIKKLVPSVVWLCIGDGLLLDDLKSKAAQLGVNSHILFLGNRENVEDFLSASDVYVGTSTFEGFGISAIEAQCNGLPCVLSQGFPLDVGINSDCVFLPLSNSCKNWVHSIINAKRVFDVEHCENVRGKGFDISSTVDFLSDFYLNN